MYKHPFSLLLVKCSLETNVYDYVFENVQVCFPIKNKMVYYARDKSCTSGYLTKSWKAQVTSLTSDILTKHFSFSWLEKYNYT